MRTFSVATTIPVFARPAACCTLSLLAILATISAAYYSPCARLLVVSLVGECEEAEDELVVTSDVEMSEDAVAVLIIGDLVSPDAFSSSPLAKLLPSAA